MISSLSSLLALSSAATVGIIVGLVVLVLVVWLVTMYNGLVRKRQTCHESWSDIDSELKRRHDLIPNLISSVKGYAAHEKRLMEEVTALRQEAQQAAAGGASAARGSLETRLGAGVNTLIATAEAYPDLKASENFVSLQQELGETETRIARARRFYNANVRGFHNACQTIPSSLIAGLGGFSAGEFDFFQLDDATEAAPVDVSF